MGGDYGFTDGAGIDKPYQRWEQSRLDLENTAVAVSCSNPIRCTSGVVIVDGRKVKGYIEMNSDTMVVSKLLKALEYLRGGLLRVVPKSSIENGGS